VARKPGRPNLNDIRAKTLELRPPKPKINRDPELMKSLQGLILQPFTIN
jgi:hypothetical protein